MVDWSGGGDRGPRPTKDAIWIAEAHAGADGGTSARSFAATAVALPGGRGVVAIAPPPRPAARRASPPQPRAASSRPAPNRPDRLRQASSLAQGSPPAPPPAQAHAAADQPLRVPRPLPRSRRRQRRVGHKGGGVRAARGGAQHQLPGVRVADHRRRARLGVLRLARSALPRHEGGGRVVEGVRPHAAAQPVRRGRVTCALRRHDRGAVGPRG